tara:strand:- start:4879 stop:5148 length:270 start_codon:yes stop_codon:yes gene_type:complete
MSDRKLFDDMDRADGFFTIAEILKGNEGVSGDYNDDYLYVVRLLFDLENEGIVYRIGHEKVDYYITPENFLKLIREQNITKILGLRPDE